MIYKTKAYLYNSGQEANGYRGADYSAYILQPTENAEDITQEIDTSELTLAGMPFNEEFAPHTKFIIDIVEVAEDGAETIVDTLHRVVHIDQVEQPILSDSNYFNHHISFDEPSIIAQQRIVDNISATYKLKDVSLEEIVAYPTTQVVLKLNEPSYLNLENFGYTQSGSIFNQQGKSVWGKFFRLTNDFYAIAPDGTTHTDIYNDISAFVDPLDPNMYIASFHLPKIQIYAGESAHEGSSEKYFKLIGYASMDYTIQEYNLSDQSTPTQTWSGSFISNSDLSAVDFYKPALMGNLTSINNEWLAESARIGRLSTTGAQYYKLQVKKYTDTSIQNAPDYIVHDIEIKAGKMYKVIISVHEFLDNLPSAITVVEKYTANAPTYYSVLTADVLGQSTTYTAFSNELSPNQYSAQSQFVFYETNGKTIAYASAVPYSALSLIQKAIINSGNYQKEGGVYIAEINNSNLPFEIDSAYLDKLQATAIIENFYNQKNLWEILIEAGHYIHAIPELRFGSDDKFLITFNELGRTDQKNNYGEKVSIHNSRNVEDYICATSSYVTNMVQLGGRIEEWIVPKSSSEDMLISNNVAELKTSKPIIELLSITVRCDVAYNPGGAGVSPIAEGATADLTPFIYEKNVYDILSIDKTLNPNRGIAMYYELGTNVIKGGDYQLPTASTNPYHDYSFKKIIYCAFNGYSAGLSDFSTAWTKIMVNNFSFYVVYRTKDDVRQNQVRPDLRKYLLNSKHDKFPQHNQFNNQQDTLVDSIKFGNNIYGKLIKTGNTSYQITEWNDNYSRIKHKGELYRIYGDLYYVSKAVHHFYSSYILSEITYSKDYNELSAVIGIPSEPRFYEISEQSSIRREVAIGDVLYLTTNLEDLALPVPYTSFRTLRPENTYLLNMEHIKNLMLNTGEPFAKYSITVFKGDQDTDLYSQAAGQIDFYKEVMLPINAYSSENTLTYEWDMADNFSAGDKVITPLIDGQPQTLGVDDAYNSLWAVPYTDIYGKSALMDFYILSSITDSNGDGLPDLTKEQIKNLPECPFTTKNSRMVGILQQNTMPTQQDLTNRALTYISPYTQLYAGDFIPFIYVGENDTYRYIMYVLEQSGNDLVWVAADEYETMAELTDALFERRDRFIGNRDDIEIVATNVYVYNGDYYNRGYGLLKDCREAISINYNLQLITSSDTFVLSPFIFSPLKSNVRIALLNVEVNKLTNGYIDNSNIITCLDANGDPIIETYVDTQGQTQTTNTFGFTPTSNSTGINWLEGQPTTYTETFRFYVNLTSILANVSANHFGEEPTYTQVKSIVVLCNVSASPTEISSEAPEIVGKTKFVLARNIPSGWTKEQALENWYFGTPKTDIFTKKQ